MTPLGWIGVATTLLALGALLLAERAGDRRGKWIAKPIASAGFLLVAITQVPFAETARAWFAAGLLLGAAGDILLIPKDKRAFLAGLILFLLGHVAYIVGFARWGLDGEIALLALLPLGVAAGYVGWHLLPHVPVKLQVPVIAYIAVITIMVVAAIGAMRFHGAAALGLGFGAFLFYASDLAVARERFVQPGFINRAWGLPAYYVGQLLIAGSLTMI